MIEVKHDKGLDPFVDDNEDQIEGTTEQSEASLGQDTVYLTCHESIQTRHTVFQALVIADCARLLRWDRSGAVVTCKIPLSDPDFFEFFWRFCHLGPEERGWDMMMEKPDRKARTGGGREGTGIEGDVKYYTKISLGKGTYITHRIFSGTQSPFGRGTRGYSAYCLTTNRVVFLKSTWRVVGDGRMPEHEIYDVLHAKNVTHIPTVVEYAEVKNHVTKTQDAPDSWRKKNVKNLRRFQHYIIVFEELCRKFEKFQSHKQLLTAFTHAAEAHQQAIDDACILHRDISAGNILITREGNGLLGDWDMAKHLDDIKDGSPQPERTGTFQFLSARFVSDEYDFGPHDRKDDVESFFHTLQWIVLRFVHHGMEPVRLGETLYSVFDATTPGPKGLVRCRGRLVCLQNSIWVRCANLTDILRDLLEDLGKTINSRYIPANDMDRAKQHYEKYQTLQKQLQLDPAQSNPDKIESLGEKRELAKLAILYEDLGSAN
ncbi:hypothetical protein M378DRAFT_89732 [Amanita muscaria Koide BX008]|uniref:Protein kinase domain-containing protein n=1 Tax=Amanita muscaria (strain Koide BX008) TaxID=946122 RepID=A0A0C2W4W5_AMAMK|nr:hypothetical protein M378DRAFT_89732 [Amanita muscaria Koide BX008]